MALKPKALGISAGIIAAAAVFIMTLLAAGTGYGSAMMTMYGTIHPGYSISVLGAFVGIIYGFICWFVAGYVLAWLYNRFEKK